MRNFKRQINKEELVFIEDIYIIYIFNKTQIEKSTPKRGKQYYEIDV